MTIWDMENWIMYEIMIQYEIWWYGTRPYWVINMYVKGICMSNMRICDMYEEYGMWMRIWYGMKYGDMVHDHTEIMDVYEIIWICMHEKYVWIIWEYVICMRNMMYE